MKKYYVKYWDRLKMGFETRVFFTKQSLITWLDLSYSNGLTDKKNNQGTPIIVYGEKINPIQVADRVRYEIRN